MKFPENVFGLKIPKGEGKSLKTIKPVYTMTALFVVVVFFIVSVLLNTFFYNKTSIANAASLADKASVKEKIVLNYNKRSGHNANIKISPPTEVDIVWEDKLNSTSLTIRPKTRWQIATEYSVNVDSVKSIFGKSMPDTYQKIITQDSPKVSATTPDNNAVNVAVNSSVILTLDSPNHDLISPRIFFEPAISSKFKASDDKNSYEISFDPPLAQSTLYKYSVFDSYSLDPASEYGKKIYEGSFTTVPKLIIDGQSPVSGGVFTDSQIQIHFDSAVERSSVEAKFSTDPKIEGVISWTDDQSLVFKPNAKLAFATNYTYKVAAGAISTLGGTLETDSSFTFTTIGVVTASFSPGWGATEIVPNKAINIYFNQEVDHTSAQNNFSISPNTGGSFGWSGSTMIYYPTGQAGYTTYSASLAAGVKSIRGLDSTTGFSTKYTTQVPNVILNVAYDRQDYALSCEFASLKMALAEQGVYVSENELIGLVGYNGPSSKTSDNKWGNPNLGFVGNISGNGTTTGYGVYWGPIAVAANRYRSSTVFTGGNAQTVTAAINAGAPVVIWGPFSGAYRMDWTDITTGENIYAVKGEHARVIKGYKGPADDPWGFYIVDPLVGSFYWSTSQLMANWGWFGNSGVIVY